MNNLCLKCGAETRYADESHCQQVFVDEMNTLLSLQNVKKACELYLSSDFTDKEWKKDYLDSLQGYVGQEVRDEVYRTSKDQRSRTTNCYSCYKPLDSSVNVKCPKCRWIKCQCGACNCNRV